MKSALRNPTVLNAAFFLSLGIALSKTHGHYSAFFICLLSLLFFGKMRWESVCDETGFKTAVADGILVATAVYFAVVPWLFSNLLIHATDPSLFYSSLRFGSAILLVSALLARSTHRSPGARVLWWLVVLAGFRVKFTILRVSPAPTIDAFTTTTAAAQFFWEGLNPYAREYVDVYAGKFGYRPTFGYWPGVLFAVTPAWGFFRDIRVAYLLAEAITFLALLRALDRLTVPDFFRRSAPLLWLFFPFAHLVLEQAWTESLLNLAIVWILIAAIARRWVWFGAGFGYFCATKQYGVFVGLLCLLYAWRIGRSAFIRSLIGASAVFLALMVPIVAWDPMAFWESSISVLLQMNLRTDQTSIPALVWHAFRISTPGWILTLVNLVAFAAVSKWMWQRKPDLLNLFQSMTWMYGVSFLFGKQASGNYFFFLAFLTLLCLALRMNAKRIAA